MNHFKAYVLGELKSMRRFLLSKERYSRVRFNEESRIYHVTSGIELKTMIEGEVRLVRSRTECSLAEDINLTS